MASTSNDELVSQFMAFTGSADTNQAVMYLEMSGQDLQTAVGLFLEHQGSSQQQMGGGGSILDGGGSGRGSGSMMGGSSSRRSRHTHAPIIPADSGGGGGGSGNRSSGGGNVDDIRAPDKTRRMQLMDDGIITHDPTVQMMTAMMEEQWANSAFSTVPPPPPSALAANVTSSSGGGGSAVGRSTNRSRSSSRDARVVAMEHDIYNDDDADDDEYEYKAMEDDDDDDGADAKNNGSINNHLPIGPAGLSEMFAAPVHLIHNAGGFQGARTMAKDSKRWLLVNIQRDAEFASHALNRDVWRDELVENLIREGFIFWQQMDISPEGRMYTERYKVYDFPHLAIIDPRTGRLLWRKEGWTQEKPMTAELFAELAMDFCSRNSFDRPPQAPRPPPLAGSSQGPHQQRSSKRPVHEMSEEEQLQEAMRASMDPKHAGSMNDSDDNNENDEDANEIQYLDSDDDDDDVEVLDSKPHATNTTVTSTSTIARRDVKPPPQPAAVALSPPPPSSSPPPRPSLLQDLLAFPVPAEEPVNGTARVQIRYPDGKRSIRKFLSTDPLKAMYAYVAQSLEEARGGREFFVMAGYPPVDMKDDLDKTMDECKLAGQVVTVRWKD